MGMFDTIYCRISLPEIGVVDDAFQSKDTPGQVLDTYEIRADGTLWRQAYDVVDRSDPKATGMKRVLGMCAHENLRWERDYLSGCLGFYGERPDGWIEFEADFRAGTLLEIRKVSEPEVRTRQRLALDAITLDQARAEEREACSQIILNCAREAEETGDLTLGLALLPLAMKVKRGGGAVPKATRGMDNGTLALLTLLGLSSRDVAVGRVSPFAEAVAAIRNTAVKTPLQAEVEQLQARVKQLVDEALTEAPVDPAQLRQAVIRQLAQDLDSSHEPDMDLILAEVGKVRRARAKRKKQ